MPQRLGAKRNVASVLVDEHANRWGIQIVELPGSHGPCECEHRDRGTADGETEDEIQGYHRALPKARERLELKSTVSELAGIITAAIKGLITPVTARMPAVRL